MIGEWLRSKTKTAMAKAAGFIGRSGVPPNVLTVTGFVLTLPVAYLLAGGRWQGAGLLLLLSGLFDALDGAVARATGRTSPFGAFLDSTLDRFGEAAVYLGLMVYYLQRGEFLGGLLVYLTIVGSFMVSYARARAEGLGVEGKGGLFTRFERLALLVLVLLLKHPLEGLLLLAVLSNITALQRVYLVWRRLSTR